MFPTPIQEPPIHRVTVLKGVIIMKQTDAMMMLTPGITKDQGVKLIPQITNMILISILCPKVVINIEKIPGIFKQKIGIEGVNILQIPVDAELTKSTRTPVNEGAKNTPKVGEPNIETMNRRTPEVPMNETEEIQTQINPYQKGLTISLILEMVITR